MAKKKIQLKPTSKLGFNDKLKICYNCMFYQKDGFCPWEETYKNYNDKCTKTFRKWPYSLFRYSLTLSYKLLDPNIKIK